MTTSMCENPRGARRRGCRISTWGIVILLAAGIAFIVPEPSRAVAAEPPGTETIVLIRHAEKPKLGLGQLDCQGLNRALALPGVIKKKFGTPDAVFAPDPGEMKLDYGHPYYYVRPLATIEPTAIAFGLPIDAGIGVSHIDALRQKLESPTYRSALVVVAWHHSDIPKLARLLVADHGGDPSVIPDWPESDFDSIYVVSFGHAGASPAVAFDQRHEGLDGQPTACPGNAPG